MELFNLLETGIPVFGRTFDVSLNWIGNLIRWLCNGVGVVGVGIILFSLALKLITLPFDIYQRISMRKQNLQMAANKEKMEKLQKQYANDKEKYNQKVMEMYKANGISMFSSCLPMILSMIIFIVAINAFNAYAQYSNVENYNTMVDAYNQSMLTYCLKDEELTEASYEQLVEVVVTPNEGGNGSTVTYTVKGTDAADFIYYKVYDTLANGETQLGKAEAISYIKSYPSKEYFVDEARAMAHSEIGADVTAYVGEHTDVEQGVAVKDYLVDKAKKAVVVAYEEKVKPNTSFLWIKNIWATDASYKNPVLSASDFVTEAKREEFEVNGKDISYGSIVYYTNAYKTDTYDVVTDYLDEAKGAANGYFILIALSIGTILLQQWIMNRSQKEQQKYSSVDGQQGSQQKMTMIIMTVMFAIFSFMYSAAFSIYMVTSNLFSMLSTLVINKLVDRKSAKKEATATVKRYENHAMDRIEQARNAGKQSAQDSKKKNK